MESKDLLPQITNKTGSVILMGGLGNVMFQMAALLSYAKDKDVDPVLGYWLSHQSEYSLYSKVSQKQIRNHHFDPWGGHQMKERGLSLGDVFPNIPWFYGRPPAFIWDFNQSLAWGYDTGQGGEYIPIETIVEETPFLIQGYFFNHEYWHHNREYILDKFKLSPSIEEYIKFNYSKLFEEKTISLHLRMGNDNDFIQPTIPPVEWYFETLNKERWGHKILVFTDNQKRANNLLDELDIPKTDIVFIDEDPHVSMFMMSMCDKHILSNSTLSFWGAYLDNKQENPYTFIHESFFHYHPKSMIPYDNWKLN